MGMTLWLHTLEDRKMSQDCDDHSLMQREADALDALCDTLGLARLSSFFDSTDFEYCLDDEFDDDGGEDGAPDPETGLPYGIDDMAWFAAAEGLVTLAGLREAVADPAHGRFDDETRAGLIEELDDCLARLRALPEGGRFHLALIM